jgi:hypothetical protein
MKISDIKRHAFRGLLSLHFVGLALTIGVRLASFGIYRATSAADLQSLSFGRDLVGVLARGLTLPGFLLTVLTGIGMVLLRYGSRPPVWVWIKVSLTTVALAIATPVVGPALDAARHWAHWSLEHGQLAAEFQTSVAKANFYGGIVFVLFVLNIPVAIWKPFVGLTLSSLLQRGKNPSDRERGQGEPRQAESNCAGEGALIKLSSQRAERRQNF